MQSVFPIVRGGKCSLKLRGLLRSADDPAERYSTMCNPIGPCAYPPLGFAGMRTANGRYARDGGNHPMNGDRRGWLRNGNSPGNYRVFDNNVVWSSDNYDATLRVTRSRYLNALFSTLIKRGRESRLTARPGPLRAVLNNASQLRGKARQ
jgi:hypothetical protein